MLAVCYFPVGCGSTDAVVVAFVDFEVKLGVKVLQIVLELFDFSLILFF